jgi:hypothetical protein
MSSIHFTLSTFDCNVFHTFYPLNFWLQCLPYILPFQLLIVMSSIHFTLSIFDCNVFHTFYPLTVDCNIFHTFYLLNFWLQCLPYILSSQLLIVISSIHFTLSTFDWIQWKQVLHLGVKIKWYQENHYMYNLMVN